MGPKSGTLPAGIVLTNLFTLMMDNEGSGAKSKTILLPNTHPQNTLILIGVLSSLIYR